MLKKTRGQPQKYPTMTHDALRAYLLSVLSDILRKEANISTIIIAMFLNTK